MLLPIISEVLHLPIADGQLPSIGKKPVTLSGGILRGGPRFYFPFNFQGPFFFQTWSNSLKFSRGSQFFPRVGAPTQKNFLIGTLFPKEIWCLKGPLGNGVKLLGTLLGDPKVGKKILLGKTFLTGQESGSARVQSFFSARG